MFVFWSLLALPTLTVLIGSIGDIISEGVDIFTLWTSDHLPENIGALRALKSDANKAKKGKNGVFQQAKPPGFMSNSKAEEGSFDNKAEENAVKGMGQGMENAEGTNFRNNAEKRDVDVAGKFYRHYLLVKEMKNVIQHIDAKPPRKYNYSEWTWFLKLLGEDESATSQHCRPVDVQQALETEENRGDAQAGTPEENGKVENWSWLGQKSPLMSSIDEPRWVLERMMSTLEKELKKMGDDHDAQDKKAVGR